MTVAEDMLADLRLYRETVDGLFVRAVRRWPQRPCVIADGRTIAYGEMAAIVDRVARGLAGLGVQPGNRVAVWMSNIWEWVAVQFAVTRIGAVLTPLNTRLRVDDLTHALADSGARVVVTQEDAAGFSYLRVLEQILADRRVPALEHVLVARGAGRRPAPFVGWDACLEAGIAAADLPPPARDPKSLAYILYTSGTTSLPKGVMLSHASLNNAINLARHFRDEDLIFLVYPLFAVTGCHNSVLAAVVRGGGVVLQERFDAAEAIQLIERHRCTVLGGIAYVLEELAAAPGFSPERVRSLRSVAIFPRRPEHLGMLRRFGFSEAPTGYGMTETSGHVTYSVPITPDSVLGEGHPWPGDEIRLRTEDGREAAPGEAGAILVRSPHLMLGYFNNPEATARAIDPDGWLHTGDVGRRDADGRLTWLGRANDIIKCAGFNFAAQEVEALLRHHPAIEEVSIVGVPDRAKGEVGAAFVVVRRGTGLRAAEVRAFCRGRIASYKVPEHVFLRDSLPKTASGKVRKVELKDWFVRESALHRVM